MTYLEKEKAKLEKKIDELKEKEDEAFLNYQDTGYTKYENQRYKYEHEAEEISRFLYAQENSERYKNEVLEYQKFIEGLKKKIADLKKDYPAKIYPDIDNILGRVYSHIINNEP